MRKASGVPSSKRAQTLKEQQNSKIGAVQPVFNKEKKQWQTPDGRCFETMLKAERHLKTI